MPRPFSKVGNRICGSAFRAAHDWASSCWLTREELGGRNYLKLRTGRVRGACPDCAWTRNCGSRPVCREGVRLGPHPQVPTHQRGRTPGWRRWKVRFGGNLGCQLMLHRGTLRLDSRSRESTGRHRGVRESRGRRQPGHPLQDPPCALREDRDHGWLRTPSPWRASPCWMPEAAELKEFGTTEPWRRPWPEPGEGFLRH